MGFHLWDLKFFSGLEGMLEAVTQDQVDKLPSLGDFVPQSAVVVGVVPDNLKALLVICGQVDDRHYDFLLAFGIALRAEFPVLADKTIVGYGPNFEIYYDVAVAVDIRLDEGPSGDEDWAWKNIPLPDDESVIGFSGFTQLSPVVIEALPN